MKFKNSLIVSVKKAKHKRLFVLQEPLICTDDKGRTWAVPKGFATDFASIPPIGRAFISKAHQNAYAAVLHDFLYFAQLVSRVEADSLFKEALASPDCNTTPLKQWVMYRAVRVGGLKAWLKIKKQMNSTSDMEASKMADETIIEEEKSLFGKFFDWIKKARTKVDEELDELEDDVRVRAKQLFRQANWPGIKDREILYFNKAMNSWVFLASYALVVVSSGITAYYWWTASPDLFSKIFFGIGFGIFNILMPFWMRAALWKGGTWVQKFINVIGFLCIMAVVALSVLASAGLQGTQNDYRNSERAHQKVEYETKLADAKAKQQRLSELRSLTTRTPSEVEAQLKGLLVTEPSPQSGCQSRDNFGSWSKRNCSRVAKLRTELAQVRERTQLEKEITELTFDGTPKVTTVDPQYQIINRYTGVDKKTFDDIKPLILAFIFEMVVDSLAFLIAAIIGEQVREELKERVKRKRNELIAQAEEDVKSSKELKADDPFTSSTSEPEPLPLSPAHSGAIVETAKMHEGQVHVPETRTEQVLESTRSIQSASSLTGGKTTPFLEETEAPAEDIIIEEPKLQVPRMEDVEIVEEPQSQNTITQVQNPVVEQEIEVLKQKIAEQEKAKEVEAEDTAKIKAENLELKFKNLTTDRAVPTEVQQLAAYALDRLSYRVGQFIDLKFALNDYEAWCTKKGLVFNKPINDFRTLLENDLGLAVLNRENEAVVLVNTEIRVAS